MQLMRRKCLVDRDNPDWVVHREAVSFPFTKGCYLGIDLTNISNQFLFAKIIQTQTISTEKLRVTYEKGGEIDTGLS